MGFCISPVKSLSPSVSYLDFVFLFSSQVAEIPGGGDIFVILLSNRYKDICPHLLLFSMSRPYNSHLVSTFMRAFRAWLQLFLVWLRMRRHGFDLEKVKGGGEVAGMFYRLPAFFFISKRTGTGSCEEQITREYKVDLIAHIICSKQETNLDGFEYRSGT